MAFNFDQALLQLSNLVESGSVTKETLFNLAQQVDINAEGSITVLYSGAVGDVSATSIASQMKLDSNLRVVDKTNSAKFLVSDEFNRALAGTIGMDLDEWNEPLITNDAKTNLKNWLFDGKTGAWAATSKRFIEATTGEVRILAGVPRDGLSYSGSVLFDTEIPALIERLNTGEITNVDGLTSSQLNSLDIDNNPVTRLDTLRNTIMRNAITQTHLSKPTISQFTQFIDLTDADFVQLQNDMTKADFNTLQELTSPYKISPAAMRVLNKLGPIGLLLGFGIATFEAGAATLRGDVQGAKDIMLLWGADAIGSVAGELVAGAVATIAVTTAVAAGVVISAPVAGAIILGAALVGGFYGADGATDMYNRFQYLDEAGKTEFLEKVSFVLFGDYSVSELPIPAGLLEGDRFTLDTSFSQANIITNAKTSMAWRYALVKLNTFVIDGDDALYAQHNQNGELDLENFTETYLNDRAQMLSWRLKYDNSDKEYTEDWNSFAIESDVNFIDHEITVSDGINTSPLTFRSDNFDLTTTDDRHIIFGSKDDNTLDGDSLDDHIYGVAGENTLSGRAGNDTLEGGLIPFLNQHKNSSNSTWWI